jgi:hypothetical protein
VQEPTPTADPTRRRVLRTIGATGVAGATGLAVTGRASADESEGEPEYPSPAWFAREEDNYAKTGEAPAEQQNPAFQERWQEQTALNAEGYAERTATEPGWNSAGNLCREWGEQCTGDPYLYPATEPLYDGDPFYEDVGERERVAFRDRGGTRLSGRVWAPADSGPGDALPGVVVTNGSVQAPETAYWWFALTLVANGYVVLTYDPRGQGRSDTTTPDGERGTNANPDVFVTNQVDAIDFFRSTPEAQYPYNEGHTDVPAPVVTHNPFAERIDPSRLGAVGHSLGAAGASVVQGLEPWPGRLDATNPVDAAVAWDNLADDVTDQLSYEVVPRVPAMGQSADYYLTPQPKEEPPDPAAKKGGFQRWRAAGVPTYQLQIRGGTHYEWSLVPTFPATAWDPGGDGGFGNPLADHYSLAWLDRWLKEPGEQGYESADARLLADAEWRDRLSFYYESARAFPERDGTEHDCTDIKGGCAPFGPVDPSFRRATDPDDDGRYEDVDGDGECTVVDVQALFANRESGTVREHPSAFDFNADGEFDVVDVQRLFGEVA